jgi:hypothetical protein
MRDSITLGRITGFRAIVVDLEGRVVGVATPSDISRAIQVGALRAMDPYPAPRGADLADRYGRAV